MAYKIKDYEAFQFWASMFHIFMYEIFSVLGMYLLFGDIPAGILCVAYTIVNVILRQKSDK